MSRLGSRIGQLLGLCFETTHFGLEVLACSPQPRRNGAERHVRHLGDFDHAELLELVKKESDAQELGHAFEDLSKEVERLALSRRVLGAWTPIRRMFRSFELFFAPAFAAPARVACHADGGAENERPL